MSHNTVSKIECVKPADLGDFRSDFSLIHTESVFHILLKLVCGCASAVDRLRFDRAWREGVAISRYNLVVFMAFDVLKINMQRGLFINE